MKIRAAIIFGIALLSHGSFAQGIMNPGGCTTGASGSCVAASFVPTGSTVPTNGMYLSSANTITFATNSTARFTIGTTNIQSALTVIGGTSAFQLTNTTASATVPTLVPNRADATTGIGAQASGNISLIAGGVEQVRVGSGAVTIPTITSDSGKTDNTVCEDSTTHQLYAGSGTLGVCLGTSSMRFKHDILPQQDGLAQVAQLKPVNFRYIKGYGDSGAREQYGFLAEDVNKVIPKLVGLDATGKPNSVDLLGLVPVLVKAIQEQQKEIEILRSHLARK